MKSIICIAFMITLPASNSFDNVAGMMRHDVNIERYREVGRMTEFESVGRYASSPSSDDYAAGVLVSDRWILTASHFIGDTSYWTFGEKTYQSKRTVLHPKLQSTSTDRQWNGWDLALIELIEPVAEVVPATRYYGTAEVGMTVTKIGYGFIGDGLNGMRSPRRSERLGGRNTIDAAGGTFESKTFSKDVLVFDFDNPIDTSKNKFGSANPLDLEIGGSKGDSGGGVFIQFNGKWTLVGIVSGALNREIKYGSVAALARVSSANEWIDGVISAKSEK